MRLNIQQILGIIIIPIENFFTRCWRKISNVDKIFCRKFLWWHAWFNDQNPSPLTLYVQSVQDEKLDRSRRNFIARKEETKRGQGYQPVIAFSTNESNKKGRKIAPFRASARFKIQFSFSISSRQSRDDTGLRFVEDGPEYERSPLLQIIMEVARAIWLRNFSQGMS